VPNSYVVDSNVDTVGLDLYQTSRPTSACLGARDSILRSHADRIKSKLDEVSGDVGATWRTAQRLLHSKHTTVYNDAECAKLVSTFCQFFAEKVNRVRDNISDALASSARRMFAVRQH